jgi:type I restriction enzyme S subunit
MKNGLVMKNLGDVCQVVGGGTPPKDKPSFYTGQIPWATVRDMKREMLTETEFKITEEAVHNSSTNIIPSNNVVIATRVGLGKVCLLGQRTAINQDLRGIIPNDPKELSVRYLFWWLKSIAHLIEAEGTGATVQGVKLPFVKSLKVPLCSPAEQKRIVGILDEAFEGIAAAKANAEKNHQNARALFESHLQSVFAEIWKTSELVTLADLTTDITDGDHLPPPKSDAGIPFITIGNIVKETREINFDDTFKVPNAYFNALKQNKKPRKGDVLYTVTGSFGIPVVIRENMEFCFQRHIGLVRPKTDIKSSWLYYLLLSPQVLKQACDGATGTAQKTVSLKVLRGFRVPKISMAIQSSMVVKLDALTNETRCLESVYKQKLDALDSLKKSLLNQAFIGQL